MWLANQVQHEDGIENRRTDDTTSRQRVHDGLIQRGVICTANSDDVWGGGNWKIQVTRNQWSGPLFIKCYKC